VLARARQVLADLESRSDGAPQLDLLRGAAAPAAPSFASELVAAIAEIDPDHLTPMQALATLVDLKRLIPEA
jgi:DNA mismatch repair ATPase MutS